jgi:peroxiredoxin
VAACSVDPPRVLEAFKAGLGARFSFLSDEERLLTDALGIRESTDRRHGPLPVPFTFEAARGRGVVVSSGVHR